MILLAILNSSLNHMITRLCVGIYQNTSRKGHTVVSFNMAVIVSRMMTIAAINKLPVPECLSRDSELFKDSPATMNPGNPIANSTRSGCNVIRHDGGPSPLILGLQTLSKRIVKSTKTEQIEHPSDEDCSRSSSSTHISFLGGLHRSPRGWQAFLRAKCCMLRSRHTLQGICRE